jgi:pilus assembly protein CpaF
MSESDGGSPEFWLPDKDADKGREPNLFGGRRMVSRAGLVERIVQAFITEHQDSAALREANTNAKRLRLVLDTAQYVLSVESVTLSEDERADLVAQVYSELFGYGPLDALFVDARVTTITLEGAQKASVRYGHGDLTPLPPLFDDIEHFQRIVARLLLDANAELREDRPYLETGLRVGERPVCFNIVAPPVAAEFNVDLRVHPAQPVTLENMVSEDVLSVQAADLLRALVASPYGFVIAGDTESGKTTLLGALLGLIDGASMATVERAGELHLPQGAQRYMPTWHETPISFGGQISAALEQAPQILALDEIRADEPHSIAPLLTQNTTVRQIWSFRSSVEPKRLINSLGMLARRAEVGQGEVLVQALHQRLPFVIALRRTQGRLQLSSIAEWQPDGEVMKYTLLMERQSGELIRTNAAFFRSL